MKIYVIQNRIYLPLSCDNNYQLYISGSIQGILFLNEIITHEYLLKKFEGNKDFKECTDLHDLCKTWGNK